jgi:hypothetical protein
VQTAGRQHTTYLADGFRLVRPVLRQPCHDRCVNVTITFFEMSKPITVCSSMKGQPLMAMPQRMSRILERHFVIWRIFSIAPGDGLYNTTLWIIGENCLMVLGIEIEVLLLFYLLSVILRRSPGSVGVATPAAARLAAKHSGNVSGRLRATAQESVPGDHLWWVPGKQDAQTSGPSWMRPSIVEYLGQTSFGTSDSSN